MGIILNDVGKYFKVIEMTLIDDSTEDEDEPEMTDMTVKIDHWFGVGKIPSLGSVNLLNLNACRAALQIGNIKYGWPASIELEKTVRLNCSDEEFCNDVKALGGILNYVQNDNIQSIKMFIWPNSCLFFTHEIKNKSMSVNFITNSQSLYNQFDELLKTKSTETGPKGQVLILTQQQYGLEFSELGIGGHELERGNYSEKVLQCFDKIKNDLNSKSPSGRLSILNGPPGTGKTYLVRALLESSTNCLPILVSPSLVSTLSNPEIVPNFIALHKNNENKPILLIIEDADSCLVSREDGNLSEISAVLNLCDGILGQILDIRIIATTNAQRMQLDKALIRPGRLSANVEVEELYYEKALEVYRRLCGKEDVTLPPKKYSLAEIYNLHNEGKTTAVGIDSKSDAKIGFGV